MVRRLPLLLLVAATAASAAPPRIEIQVDGGPWTEATSAAPLRGQSVRLRVDAEPGATIRWHELLPDLDKDHHNAEWPWNPGAYAWLGFERVAVRRVEVASWRDRREVDLPGAVPPALPAGFTEARPWLRRRDAGSFWLQVEVQDSRGRRSSPGPEAGDARGLAPATLRLSVRDGDGYLGWIATFFNVPSVFGSTPHQSRNWLGADCADVVSVARGAWLDQPLDRDWNVAALVTTLRQRGRRALVEGRADAPLRWHDAIRPGDLIAVRFPGGRHWQHVGVLHSDADGDGVLSAGDVVLHAGPLPLRASRLAEGVFDGEVVVLDPATTSR